MLFHTDNSAVGSTKRHNKNKIRVPKYKNKLMNYHFSDQDRELHCIPHEKGSARDSVQYDKVSLPVPSSLPCEREWHPPRKDPVFLNINRVKKIFYLQILNTYQLTTRSRKEEPS